MQSTKALQSATAAAVSRTAPWLDATFARYLCFGSSKREAKRRLRLERNREKWKERKLAAKEAKKQKRLQKRLAAGETAPVKRKAEELTEEEKAHKEEARARRAKRKQDFIDACTNGVRVALDLSYEEKMRDREVTSLVQQIMYCYGVNNRSPKPFRFCLTSLNGSTESKCRKIAGFDTWPIFPDSRHYLEVFNKEEIVYLSADADNTLEKVDPAKVYVIGGIVDRNRYPGLTHKQAVAAGVRTEKLPIGGFIKLASSTVLTCNHTFEILNHFAVHGDWEEAFFSVRNLKNFAPCSPLTAAGASATAAAHAIPRRKNLQDAKSKKERRRENKQKNKEKKAAAAATSAASACGGGGSGGGNDDGRGGQATQVEPSSSSSHDYLPTTTEK